MCASCHSPCFPCCSLRNSWWRFLWLDLAEPTPGALRPVLVHAFQGYAEVFWPVFAPLAAFLIEPERLRQRLILICLVVGVCLSAYLLMTMIAHPYAAFVGDGHIIYKNDHHYPPESRRLRSGDHDLAVAVVAPVRAAPGPS